MKNSQLFLLVVCLLTSVSIAFGQANPDVSGSWLEYRADGSKGSTIVKIFQNTENIVVSFAGNRVNGTVRGNEVTLHDWTNTGTLTRDGNRIQWSDGGNWYRIPNLKGNWRGLLADGSLSQSLATIDQTQETLYFDNGEGSKSRGRFERDKIIAEGWNVTGTMNGANQIVWSNSTRWLRAEAANNTPAPAPQETAAINLNGSWTCFFANGTKAPKPGTIRQNGAAVVIDNGEGSRSNGRIEGARIIATDWNLIGTIVSEGKRINWSNDTMWILSSAPLAAPPPVTTAPPSANLEQQCYQAVQGKVAWNRAGETRWSDANVRSLCKGTTNPSATIACFQNQIRQHDQWGQAIAACAPSSNNAPSLPNLSGSWRGYYEDGSLSPFVWAVGQNGGALTFADIGAGSNRRTTARLLNSQTIEADWGTTGRLSSDGKRIAWSDKTTWVLIPNLNGNWIGYYEDGSKSPFVWAVRQTGATVMLEDIAAGSGRKSKGRIEGNKIIAEEWNLTATISSDGKRIAWANGTFWTPNAR